MPALLITQIHTPSRAHSSYAFPTEEESSYGLFGVSNLISLMKTVRFWSISQRYDSTAIQDNTQANHSARIIWFRQFKAKSCNQWCILDANTWHFSTNLSPQPIQLAHAAPSGSQQPPLQPQSVARLRIAPQQRCIWGYFRKQNPFKWKTKVTAPLLRALSWEKWLYLPSSKWPQNFTKAPRKLPHFNTNSSSPPSVRKRWDIKSSNLHYMIYDWGYDPQSYLSAPGSCLADRLWLESSSVHQAYRPQQETWCAFGQQSLVGVASVF